MYDKEDLAAENTIFISEHGPIQESDVEAVNQCITQIIQSRSNRPQPGDLVEYTTRYGGYWLAFIEAIGQDGNAEICLSGGYAFTQADTCTPTFTTSGGPWVSVRPDFEYVGKKDYCFRTAGHCGFCAHCSLNFYAPVNVWRYSEPDPLFGEYSSKDYNMIYVCETKQRSKKSHFHFNGRIVENEIQYCAWLKTYKGVEFLLDEQDDCKTLIAFTYRPQEHYIPIEKWDMLELPTDTRIVNASIVPIKYEYDDANHLIHEYRYTNAGGRESEQSAYRVAMQQIQAEGISRCPMELSAKI